MGIHKCLVGCITCVGLCGDKMKTVTAIRSAVVAGGGGCGPVVWERRTRWICHTRSWENYTYIHIRLGQNVGGGLDQALLLCVLLYSM